MTLYIYRKLILDAGCCRKKFKILGALSVRGVRRGGLGGLMPPPGPQKDWQVWLIHIIVHYTWMASRELKLSSPPLKRSCV